MNIRDALVCLDCDELVDRHWKNQAVQCCPKCQSPSLMPLYRWIKPIEKRPQFTKEKL